MKTLKKFLPRFKINFSSEIGINYYNELKNHKYDIIYSLPTTINDTTEIILKSFFLDYIKLKNEERDANNYEIIDQLDQTALDLLAMLRENGASSLKVQGFYQYLL